MPSAAPERTLTPAKPLVDRFRADLAGEYPFDAETRMGVAVSGGPDSLALLLLAHAAFPWRVAAATVDHGLRSEGAAEAAMVAGVCARLGLPHETLKGTWDCDRGEGLQAAAREYRYRELTGWCARRRLALLATAHHADDQAETLLLRLARGAGVGGLAGIRAARWMDERGATNGVTGEKAAPARHLRLVRPLLRFTKVELREVVAAAGLTAVEDPSNADDRFDRTRARRLLAATDWLNPARIAASASHLADADSALGWAADAEFGRRVRQPDRAICEWTLDPAGLPHEILRRMVERLIHMVEDHAVPLHDGPDPAGPELTRFIARLKAGETATIWHVLARPGPLWRFKIAPPRRP